MGMDQSTLIGILLPIAVIQFLGWATPGANHLVIITASVTKGRGAGIRAALGIAAGAVSWALIAVSGIAVVFELYPPLYTGLRLAGAAYLIFLGSKAFRSAQKGGMFDLSVKEGATIRAPFRAGYLVMMTNPKSVLFFGSILTAFIPPDGSRWIMLTIVAQMGLQGAILNVIGAYVFSSNRVVSGFRAASFWVSILFGTLFCMLGALVAWEVIAL